MQLGNLFPASVSLETAGSETYAEALLIEPNTKMTLLGFCWTSVSNI
jgi:hypothetical protein